MALRCLTTVHDLGALENFFCTLKELFGSFH